MSFSSDIKESLCKSEYRCPNCARAELAGFLRFTGRLGGGPVKIHVTLVPVAHRLELALKEGLGINTAFEDRKAVIDNKEDIDKLTGELAGITLKRNCCKSAFIRGAFLGGGSVSDPSKTYHLEFATKCEDEADKLIELLKTYGINARKTHRKEKPVVYMKESSQIADVIGYMSGGMLGLEILSVQMEKEFRSSVTRQVNCDSANISKQVKASSRQLNAIKKIKDANRWQLLPEVLREIGDLREKYPDMSLEELGGETQPKIGKSGVNHRLNRIISYADAIE